MSQPGRSTAGATPSGVQAVRRPPLLVGVFAGPIIWSLHLVISEFLISGACATGPGGFSSFTIAGATGWRVVLLIVTAVFALLILGADVLAFRLWRKTGSGTRLSGEVGGPAGRSGWLAPAGVLMSTMFLFGTLLAGASIFWLSGCT